MALLMVAAPAHLAGADDGQRNGDEPAPAPGQLDDAAPEGTHFGIGPLLGDPTGATFEWMMTDEAALDLGVGIGVIHGEHFLAKLDFIWLFLLGDFRSGTLDLRLGVGPRVGIFFDHGAFDLGWRIPIGLDWTFAGAPIDLFADFAPGMWLVRKPRFDVDVNVGMRFWF